MLITVFNFSVSLTAWRRGLKKVGEGKTCYFRDTANKFPTV